MRTCLNADDIFLKKCRQNCLCYTLVFHEVFEHGIVDRVGNVNYHIRITLTTLNAANIRFIFRFPNIMRKYLLLNNLKYNDLMTKVANNYSSFSS